VPGKDYKENIEEGELTSNSYINQFFFFVKVEQKLSLGKDLQKWWQYLQNVFYSLGASRSVWENAECKLTSVNLWRVSDPGIRFWPAVGLSGISDVLYCSTMRVILISLGTPQGTGKNIGGIWGYLEAPVYKPRSADNKPGSTWEPWQQVWQCQRHVWEHLESQ